MQRGAEEQGIRVLSSGWGGGVSFNGYDYLEQLLLSGRWEKLAAGCRDRGMSLRGLLFDWCCGSRVPASSSTFSGCGVARGCAPDPLRRSGDD